MARQFTEATLLHWRLNSTDATMVVGELATNAVVHGRTAFTVELTSFDGRVRVAVLDQNPRLPSPTSQSPDARSGRGLHIVERLSISSGMESIPDDGKAVWAVLEALPVAHVK
jgi:anti-sigma regulatory factor (Ser/Thr protein kinase)